MTTSVCMASFNGERYIYEQVVSILSQLEYNDELIVVDDSSSDSTFQILASLNDPRLKIYRNEVNVGVNKTFERAISLSSGDYIFLSDQDDIWLEGRVDLMLKALRKKVFVATNFGIIDKNGLHSADFQYRLLKKSQSLNFFGNLVGILLGLRDYYGCAMAFRSSLKSIILPFPTYVESHDLWIAIAANSVCSVIHIEDHTLLHRIHGANASVVDRPLIARLFSRVIFVRSFFEIIYRIVKLKRWRA